jgi:hypothetical protein
MYRYPARSAGESDPERKSSFRAVTDQPYARNRLTSRPQLDSLETLFSDDTVADVGSWLLVHHAGRIALLQKRTDTLLARRAYTDLTVIASSEEHQSTHGSNALRIGFAALLALDVAGAAFAQAPTDQLGITEAIWVHSGATGKHPRPTKQDERTGLPLSWRSKNSARKAGTSPRSAQRSRSLSATSSETSWTNLPPC